MAYKVSIIFQHCLLIIDVKASIVNRDVPKDGCYFMQALTTLMFCIMLITMEVYYDGRQCDFGEL